LLVGEAANYAFGYGRPTASDETAIVWIKWIGNHKAHDKIDVTEMRHGR
jgi:hypothetical protein